MKSISLGDVSGFFTWKLDQKRGVAGRRLRGIKEASSLATYRKMFLRVYRKLVGADMDSEMARGTLNVGYIPLLFSWTHPRREADMVVSWQWSWLENITWAIHRGRNLPWMHETYLRLHKQHLQPLKRCFRWDGTVYRHVSSSKGVSSPRTGQTLSLSCAIEISRSLYFDIQTADPITSCWNGPTSSLNRS